MAEAQGEARGAAGRDRPSPDAGRCRRGDLRRRRHPDGSFTGAGSIELGLHRDLVERLEARLAELPARRRGTVAWYPAEVSVVASLHGLPDRPVRDAILRHVLETDVTAEWASAASVPIRETSACSPPACVESEPELARLEAARRSPRAHSSVVCVAGSSVLLGESRSPAL